MKTCMVLITFAIISCSGNTSEVEFVRENDTGCVLLADDPDLNNRVRDFLKKNHPNLWRNAEFNWEVLGPLRCNNDLRYFGRSRPRHVGMHFIIKIEDGNIDYLPGL